MYKAARLNRHTKIQEEASLWLFKIEQELTAQEKQLLVAWLNQDKLHYLALHNLSNNHPVLSQLSGLFPVEVNTNNHLKSKAIFFISFAFLFSLIIACTLNILSLLGVEFFAPNHIYSKQYVTQVGEKKTFQLQDGSAITLNTNTIVSLKYSNKQRALNLIQGEALFSVAKDPARPFTVLVGDNSFTALGTIFNIQKGSKHSSELVVTEGSVLISDANHVTRIDNNEIDAPTMVNALSDEHGVILSAGQKTAVSKNSPVVINKLALDQIQKDLAWQQDMLIFNGESLQAVLQDVARYHPFTFEVTEQQLKHVKVAGYFKTNDIMPLLTALNYNFDISHEIIGDKIRLSSNSRIQ